MRGAIGLTAILIGALLPGLCESSAAGNPHWSRIDFTESTHLGPMRVLITTSGAPYARRIARIRIWSKGRELRVPGGDAARVADPELHRVNLTYAASYTCIEDDCPDVRTWPAMLIIPFGDMMKWGEGERPVSNSCDQSFLSIDILADRVAGISINECTRAGSRWRDIFVEK